MEDSGTSTSGVEYAKGVARGRVRAGDGDQPRTGGRAPSRCSRTIWFRNTWSWVARRGHGAEALLARPFLSRPWGRVRLSWAQGALGPSGGSTSRATPTCSSRTTRRTANAPLGRAEHGAPRQGRVSRGHRERGEGRGKPGAPGTKAWARDRRPRAGREPRLSPAPDHEPMADRSPASRARCARGSPKRTTSTTRSSRRSSGPTSAASTARRWPAALDQAVLRLRRRRGSAATRLSPPPPSRLDGRNPSGATSTTAKSSRCPTSGSTPGTRPGTSPSTASRSRSMDPEFAKQQLAPLARVVHAPERAAAGLRVGLRRRESARARLGRLRVYQIERRTTGRPIARSSKASFTS